MSFTELRLLPLLALAACTSAGKPANPPRLEGIEPAQVYVDEPTALVIHGEAFNPRATLRWGGGDDLSTQARFELFVEEQPLTEVTWLSSTTLTATAPAGLPVGKHPVRLVDPYGVSAVLPDGLEVRARHGGVLTATLTTDASSARVLKQLVAHLDLTNPGDVTVDAVGALQLAATGTAEVSVIGVTPGKTSLKPGETTRFDLAWISRTVGTVVLSAEARGVDARTGSSVRVGPLTTPELQIVPPPDVTSTLTAARRVVSQGQVIELTLEANNIGQTGVKDLLPLVTATPAGLVDPRTAPLKRDVPAGQQQSFSFSFDTRAVGDVSFRADALGLDAPTNAPVAMTPAFETVTVVKAATLAVTLVASAGQIGLGQRVTLTATVTNTGGAKALAVTPTVALTGTGALTLVSAPAPSTVATTPVSFVWQYDGLSKGPVQLTVIATGRDENSGAAVGSAPSTVSVLVAQPPALATTFSTPQRVNVGQSFGWAIDVANTGGSATTAVTPGPITVLAAVPGGLDGGPTPSAQDISGGASRSFGFGYIAAAAGPLRFQASPAGTDAVSGSPVVSPVATSPLIVVERPAQLVGALSIPASLVPLASFAATLQVANAGDATALGVAPASLAVIGSATVVSGPTPTSATIPGDGGVTFSWQLTAGTSGNVQVSTSATGTDANEGSPRTTGPLSSNTAAVSELEPIATDPFADGTAFSFVFSYANRVWLGPRKSGFGAVSMAPDGTAPADHAFSFARDVVGGQTHKNTSAAPYPSIGAQGCTANTAGCGPDNENGRGIFFAGMFGATEWLGVAGARAGGQLDYVYLSSDTDPTIDFRYVDLGNALGGATQGTSAAHFFNNRLYLGFPDSGGNRPYFIALLVPPPSPGLESLVSTSPTAGVTVLQLDGDRLPGIGQNGGNNAPVEIIDTVTDFNDRLYVANNGGIVRTTTNLPRGPQVAPGDWLTSTPTAAAFTAKTSITTTKVAELLPSDKAFPAIAAYQGRLYAARNTVNGPQLWACNPGLDGFCAPSEWSLIAANSAGDLSLSQFNDASNTTLGLLAATSTTLFVGFNNATGLQLFKTTVAQPSSRSDFTGAAGCVAGAVGCQGIGMNGLGAPTINRQIFDARALTFGASAWLYLVTGNGTSGVRVWRIGG